MKLLNLRKISNVVLQNATKKHLRIIMKAHTKETQAKMTAAKGLQALKDGNARYQQNIRINRNLIEQTQDTANGQAPFATILSCIDSRVPAEIVFDQGIGDIFSARIAGNVVSGDVLGSIEFACKLAGTRLVVVLGHTSCGAVKGACDKAELGNLTGLLNKIAPAVEAITEPTSPEERTSKNLEFVNNVAEKNVKLTIEEMRRASPTLAAMENDEDEDKRIRIIGAMYDISNGHVTFYE